ncbi:MAG: efflux RND transporter periplasmic adaptor subunit [Verrucomicrobia bacterium]|nr:efflux RND transporter periplasmic adaptor subunit [Verrucomicrobiota bacterium]
MKRYLSAVLIAAVAGGVFVSGHWFGKRGDAAANGAGGRKVLYYVDPMNPSHTTDKPGFAPCGMKMEPVYADEAGGVSLAGKPAGTVRIGPEKQQMIGVRTSVVEKKPLAHTVRLLGKVAYDETRLYKLTATVDGWITKGTRYATGDYVTKGTVLGNYYSPELLRARQALMFAVTTRVGRAVPVGSAAATNVVEAFRSDPTGKLYTAPLKNLGMGDKQIEEIIQTRVIEDDIRIIAPADGFIVARNVSLGQSFDKGGDLFTIADLRKVWIQADVFEDQAAFIRPKMEARVSLPQMKKNFTAKVSEVLPRFDTQSRTLKVRLEVDNPDIVLKPDMFVDVEFPINQPPAIVVSVDAVLDTGLRRTVFVDHGHGVFEPRAVETGTHFGDQVEIVQGLKAGERIVTSGNFLIDSESRMKLAAAGLQGPVAKDPVCNMDVDESKATAASRSSQHEGKSHFFCCDNCKQKFDKDPDHFLGSKAKVLAAIPKTSPAKDPICDMDVDIAQATAAKLVSQHEGKSYFFCADGCKKQFDRDPSRFMESKAKPMVAAAPTTSGVDPICGMTVDLAEAKAAKRISIYQGRTIPFCADGCKAEFDRDPAKFMKKSGQAAATPSQLSSTAACPAKAH